MRLNPFHVFSYDAERTKNTQKEIFAFNNAWGTLKGQYFKKNEVVDYLLA
jgi:hypothetical protein